jgi:glycosyltransferase involved in cell wall biosynthesis
MQNNPLVSLCLPVYNGARFIAYTLDSLLLQTYGNIEIIISDDCSTDNLNEILQTYNDERISYFKNTQNCGITYNWNKAVSLAKGKYIKLICQDDILAPDCIEEQVRVLEEDQYRTIALVICRANIIDINNQVILQRKSVLIKGLNNPKRVINKCAFYGTNIIGEPMVGLMRADAIVDIEFDGSNKYMIDLDFWFKLIQKGQVYLVDKTLASFRVSKNSLSANLNFKQPVLFQKFIRKVKATYKIPLILVIFSHISSLFMGIVRNVVFLITK